MKKIPNSLRVLFIIHFIIDYILGVPLLFFPEWTLQLFGFAAVENLTARIVGAALLGIGGISLLKHKGNKESFETLLSLKIMWASAAIIGIILTIIEGAPMLTRFILGIFVTFNIIWIYYKKRLSG